MVSSLIILYTISRSPTVLLPLLTTLHLTESKEESKGPGLLAAPARSLDDVQPAPPAPAAPAGLGLPKPDLVDEILQKLQHRLPIVVVPDALFHTTFYNLQNSLSKLAPPRVCMRLEYLLGRKWAIEYKPVL